MGERDCQKCVIFVNIKITFTIIMQQRKPNVYIQNNIMSNNNNHLLLNFAVVQLMAQLLNYSLVRNVKFLQPIC